MQIWRQAKVKETGFHKIPVCGIEIDNVSMDEAVDKIIRFSFLNDRKMVFTPNVDHIILYQTNVKFRKAYENADLVLVDGMPIVLTSRLKGTPFKEKVSGSDIYLRILEAAKKLHLKILIFGGKDLHSTELIKSKVLSRYPDLRLEALYPEFGYEKSEGLTSELINKINEIRPDIIFACTGSPKTEIWLNENRAKLHFGVALSLGATVDFITGAQKRAPKWMQKFCLEWFYRLLQNPKKLWKRYLRDMSYFVYLLKYQLLQNDVKYEFRLLTNRKNILPRSYVLRTLEQILFQSLFLRNKLAQEKSSFRNDEIRNEVDVLYSRALTLLKISDFSSDPKENKILSKLNMIHQDVFEKQNDLIKPGLKVL